MTQQGSKYFGNRFGQPTRNQNPLKWMIGATDKDLQDEYELILKKESTLCATKRAYIVEYINKKK